MSTETGTTVGWVVEHVWSDGSATHVAGPYTKQDEARCVFDKFSQSVPARLVKVTTTTVREVVR